jgi:hypothetical protein
MVQVWCDVMALVEAARRRVRALGAQVEVMGAVVLRVKLKVPMRVRLGRARRKGIRGRNRF